MERIKTAVITGGSGGIGSECAALFAKNGYCAAIIYNTARAAAEKAAERLSQEGCSVFALRCDVSDFRDCEQALREVNSRGCAIDLLVNCAGEALIKPLADTTPEDFDRIYAVNMRGVFNMTRAGLPYFLRTHSGAVINISSVWGICGSSCETAYSAAKAAVIGFTKAAAKELAPSGITVNCIAPGVIDTPMNAGLTRGDIAQLEGEIPLGRLGAPEEVARAALFFAANRHITGQILGVDGGFGG